MTTEKELRPIVEDWLQGKGYYVAHEVRLSGRYCDLIGCKWAERISRRIPAMLEIIAVELKIRDIVGVLYQAKNNSWRADYSYAAMPLKKCESMKPAKLKLFKNIGLGLLGVSDCVHVIVKARKNKIKYSENTCRNLWNFKVRHERQSSPRGV